MRTFPTVLIFLATLSGMADSFTMTLPVGISAIANPFNNGANSAYYLFPNEDASRDGDWIFTYNGDGHFSIVQFDSTAFSGFSDPVTMAKPAPILPPGRGFFYYNWSGASESVTFTGTPPSAVFPSPFSYGCGKLSFLGAQNTNASTYQDYVGAAPVNGSQVLIHVPSTDYTSIYPFDSTNYNFYTYTNGAWVPTNPPLAMGMAAFFYTPCSSTLQFAQDVNGPSYTNAHFRVTLNGPSGSNAVISASSDWHTWTPMVTNPLTGGSLNFTDALATNFTRRFYKAQLQ